jgi:hypothetical protein
MGDLQKEVLFEVDMTFGLLGLQQYLDSLKNISSFGRVRWRRY